MAQNYLTTSRHGTMFYFRRRVPDDLRALVGKRYLVTSLGCARLREAVTQARALAARTDHAFRVLRAMAADNQTPDQSALMALINLKRRELRLQDELEAEREDRHKQELRTANKLLKQHAEIEALKRDTAASGVDSSVSSGIQAGSPAMGSKRVATGVSVGEVWERYKAEKIALGVQGAMNGWKDGESAALYHHLPHVREFWERLPMGKDTPIAAVTFEDAVAFQTAVTAKPGESGNNKSKRLMRVGALFRWAKEKRHVADDLAAAFKYQGKLPKNNYLKFSPDDLKALFESEVYRTGAFSAPHQYWLLLLGLFTGGRLNELCQLCPSDIVFRDGVWVISILDEERGKRAKTAASRRLIPVHSKLIELGFLTFVDGARKARGEAVRAPACPGSVAPEPVRYRAVARNRRCTWGRSTSRPDSVRAPTRSCRTGRRCHSSRSSTGWHETGAPRLRPCLLRGSSPAGWRSA